MILESILEYLATLFWSGWTNLLDYLAAHVLLCLVPAFVIAGYMSAMIPQEAITRYLGPRASRLVSYPAAAIGGFILAVCSCTILPLFAGIWKRGAGLGPAITFLFVGPAVNILAIAYTGAAIGMDIAIARIVLSIVFGVAIGLIMTWVFRKQEADRAAEMAAEGMFDGTAEVKSAIWVMFVLLIAVLIIGTLQVEFLTNNLLSLRFPIDIPESVTSNLANLNLAPHGALLIMLLLLLAPAAYLGLENILERFNRWTYLSISLVALTLLTASLSVSEGNVVVGITGRFIGELFLIAAIGVVAARNFERYEIAEWLWETWKFIKQIFPLLVFGVFIAGMVRVILPQELIQSLAGKNTISANFIAVVFGVFLYFPTLVEVPIARMFLDLGMHRGPLLAYLLADPELSIQSILVTGRILGRRKTVAYVALVSVFSTLAGYIFGYILAAF
ncbi:MAG: permease [Anaerolineales bacterium]|nr:permease [Anaerolineales bacterium]